MKMLIGIVGTKGSGKGAFVSLLKEKLPDHHIEALRFSDILHDTLMLWGDVSSTRENLQKLAVMMNQMGNGTLSRAMRTRVLKSPADIVVLDGVRWESDLAMLRSFPNNMLVYIYANPRIRFERLLVRNEKIGEGAMSWEQFTREENALNETSIPEIGKQADVTIINNGSFSELSTAVDTFVRTFKTALA
jgi:dephospho-CoA kinase